MKNTGKRYYKVGERIWISSKKTSGVVLELQIKPEHSLYKAVVEYNDGSDKVEIFSLWEIEKHKKDFFKKKRDESSKRPVIIFAKVRPTAIIPSKESENAGYDIYANFEQETIIVKPHTVELIPTGIASAVEPKWYLEVKERGSTGSKNIARRAGVIDSGYRGEIFVAIANDNDIPVVITKNVDLFNSDNAIVYPYEKAIAQLVLLPVPDAEVIEYSYEELMKIPSIRGTGKVGSSNK